MDIHTKLIEKQIKPQNYHFLKKKLFKTTKLALIKIYLVNVFKFTWFLSGIGATIEQK